MAKRIVIGQLGSRLSRHDGHCVGFVIMPDHVHALLWFPETGEISSFMNKWKDLTSRALKGLYRRSFLKYSETLSDKGPIWQPKYYALNVFTRRKFEEKLEYMHMNPVRAGLAERATDWRWSSARWYLERRSVGPADSMAAGNGISTATLGR
jgi:putative transposase